MENCIRVPIIPVTPQPPALCAAGEVPGSAVLLFEVELIDVEEGLPEGYMFIWNEDVSPDLFSEMDKDNNKQVEPSEVCHEPPAVILNY